MGSFSFYNRHMHQFNNYSVNDNDINNDLIKQYFLFSSFSSVDSSFGFVKVHLRFLAFGTGTTCMKQD